jgi:UDP-N-acetylglucosamine--N-acetylmuramyl-(pentapeptide) pyrophosphoryl-undecaprenol N-acetylglucosamine transferase
MAKRILFTGGGSAGHVTVNLALIPRFAGMGWDVLYMGSKQGIEAQLIEKAGNVRYIGIATGKLRRYLDWQNVKDPFRVVKGVYEAYRHIRHEKPDVVFSKGGFVSVPVVLGAWLNKVPVVIHESDLTPGLANKIAGPFAARICTTFPETLRYVKSGKAVHVGAVIRQELRLGNAVRGLELCDFTSSKPVMLVMGGSLGSQRINGVLRRNLEKLLGDFQIVHICGKGQADPSLNRRGYKQFEYVHEELPDILAAADFVVSRAGSNAIFEFLALHKPMLLIPLSKQASRGDQILNAQAFERSGYGDMLPEEELTDETFVRAVYSLYGNLSEVVERMAGTESVNPIEKLTDQIIDAAKNRG